MDDADIIVDEAELMGEAFEEVVENDPDKPMYAPLNLGEQQVGKHHNSMYMNN